MRAAIEFLARFKRAIGENDLLHVLADDPDGFGAALEAMPEELGMVMEQAVGIAHGAPVVVSEECFASASCNSDGKIIAAGARFTQWFAGADVLAESVRRLGPGQSSITLLADDVNGRRVALAAGRAEAARLWPLDAPVRAALQTGAGSHAAIAFRPSNTSLSRAARACRLTPAEAMLVASLARHGDLQRAAQDRGVAYETARKFVAGAMRKTGARRQADLIRQTLLMAAGDLPDSAHLALLTRDLFDLTERQAKLAVLVARGETREQAAALLGMADHSAKADLRTIFLAFDVQSAAELSRVMTEISAVQGLATACEVTVTPRGHARETLRLVPRPGRPQGTPSGRIAVADHGPPDGLPVVIFHSSTGGRHQSRSLIAALQAGGFRPIAWDRAGYGLSDPVPGDPIAAGVRDLAAILAALDIAEVAILSRGATATVIACAAALGDRLAGAVLLVPETPAAMDGARLGLLGRAKGIFYDRPEMAASFARVLSRRTSAAAIARLYRVAVRGQESDQHVLDDPKELADLVRSSQQSAAGMHGFLNELLAHGRGGDLPCLADASRWTLFYGGQDCVFYAADARALWARTLPGAVIRTVPDGGRFMHVTHADQVVDALRGAFDGSQGRSWVDRAGPPKPPVYYGASF